MAHVNIMKGWIPFNRHHSVDVMVLLSGLQVSQDYLLIIHTNKSSENGSFQLLKNYVQFLQFSILELR